MKYRWKAPKYKDGDWVEFRDSWGHIRRGIVCDVETGYDNEGVAGHSYRMVIHDVDAKRRGYHASEEDVWPDVAVRTRASRKEGQ